MIPIKLKLFNYKQFVGEHNFSFEKLNLISGPNGIGKSNGFLYSWEFLIYGYTDKKKLQDIVTRTKKKGYVEGEIKKDNDIYVIKREYPTNLSIKKNNKLIGKEWNLTEKERYLRKIFGDINYFKQFKLIDAYDKDTNFLEKGPTAIKKTLLSINTNKLDNIKTNLLDIRRERDRYNRDHLELNNHYASKKRLNILKQSKLKIENQQMELEKKLNKAKELYYKYKANLNKIKDNISTAKAKIYKVIHYKKCYVCYQTLSAETRNRIIRDRKQDIKNETINGKKIIPKIKKYKSLALKFKHQMQKLTFQWKKIKNLEYELETKLKQSKFKFTTKDVEIVTKALKKLDGFSSSYLVNRIQVLEPVVNAVLSKIKFKIKFDVNEHGKFNMILTDDKKQTWSYRDLSSGQKLILQIAMKFALLIERGDSNTVLIADEGLNSLDSTNLLHIIQLLNNFPFYLIMILHRFKNIPTGINVIDLKKEFKSTTTH